MVISRLITLHNRCVGSRLILLRSLRESVTQTTVTASMLVTAGEFDISVILLVHHCSYTCYMAKTKVPHILEAKQ